MKGFALAATLAAAALPALGDVETYNIDPKHTFPQYEVGHLGYSFQRGRFNKTEGKITMDPAAKSGSAEVRIDAASVSSGVDKLDEHLKSPDFFDAAKFPTATFKSTKVEAAGDNKLKVSGDLTIHGVTKPVVLDVTINKIGQHPMAKVASAGFDASVTLLRSDFGVGNYAPAVSDQVKLQITMEAREAKP